MLIFIKYAFARITLGKKKLRKLSACPKVMRAGHQSQNFCLFRILEKYLIIKINPYCELQKFSKINLHLFLIFFILMQFKLS